MANHTPGPWSVSQKKTDPDDAYADEHYQISGAPFGHAAPWIAETYGGLLTGQAEANAHLIAAAPELLEACEKCERLLLDIGDPFRGDHWQMMQDIRAAIAKAKGKEVEHG